MDKNDMKKLASTQITALADMARQLGHHDIEGQLRFMAFSLDNDAAPVAAGGTQNDAGAEERTESTDDFEDFDDFTAHSEDFDDYDDYARLDGFFDEEEGADAPEAIDGFNSVEEYQQFAEDNDAVIRGIDEDTGEEQTLYPDAIAGVVRDDDGNYREVGNLEESLETAHEIFRESNTIRDEETGEVLYENEPDALRSISFIIASVDGRELTATDVTNRVFNDPQTNMMLDVFGSEYRVDDMEDAHEKSVSFFLDPENTTQQKAAQMIMTAGTQMLTVGGKIVVPGVGEVSCRPVM